MFFEAAHLEQGLGRRGGVRGHLRHRANCAAEKEKGMPPREAAAPITDLLLGDAVGGANGGGDRLAERGLVDEVVLDHCGGDLGLVDPERNQE